MRTPRIGWLPKQVGGRSAECMMNAAHTYAAVPTGPPPEDFTYPGAGNFTGPTVYDDARRSQLGATKMFRTLRQDDTHNFETSSVYGLAIVLPQLARSAGWPVNFTMAALRSYLYLSINCAVQLTFLYMISKEEEVMDAYSGQMYLCDLGAGVDRCPNGPGCLGPGGTPYSAPRMYPFDQWVTRNFVRDSLKAIFPDKVDLINKDVDPGEYGLESYKCRLMCCFLFMVSLTSEFFTIVKILHLIYSLPNKAEMWFEYEPETKSEVGVKLAGMSYVWKAFNLIFVVAPKLFLWKLTCQAGVHFLLDTSGIVDVISNSVALGFILSVDELVFENLTSQDTKDIMGMVNGFNVQKVSEPEPADQPEEFLLDNYFREKMNRCSIGALLPTKLLFVLVLTFVFVAEYYYNHCRLDSDGRWIPSDLYLPSSVNYSLLRFLVPSFFPEDERGPLVWSMPSSGKEETES